MTIILAATHHDPDGRMLTQTERVLPALARHFAAVAVFLTAQTVETTDTLLLELGATVERGDAMMPVGHGHLGLWRRAALASALATWPDATGYLFCDLDRALHWAEYHPAELGPALAASQSYDCLVYGRTARAFASHPQAQRATEALANHGFALASGLTWDVMTAARGLSRAAAELIVRHCTDDTVGSDCSWPLLCRQAGLTLGYLETEGMEFETLDRYADELAALGGPEAWLTRFDADPHQWLVRTELARAEIASAIAYATPDGRA